MKYSTLISAFIIGVCIFSGIAAFYQGSHQAGCSLDGSEIHPLYEVIIIQKNSLSNNFACIASARIWFSENIEHISSVVVTDETTGEKINAQDAFYVLSEVVTTSYTGNRIHAFAEKRKARFHAGQFKGKLVKNPFVLKKRKPAMLVKQKADPRSSHDFFAPDSQNPLSLPFKIVLMNWQDYSCLFHEYPILLFNGHFNPPDKPPRIPV